MKTIFLSLLIFLSFASFGQERAVLDWNFFKNDRPANAPHQAFTWYNLGYIFKPVMLANNQISFQFEVTFKMDAAKSYFDFNRKKAEDYELLNHEQGHADIGFLYALKLKQAFAKTTFVREDFQVVAKKIFDGIYKEMTAENIRYDQETAHFSNKTAQKNWDEYLKTQLAILAQ